MEQSTVDEMLAWQSGVRLAAVAEKLRARGFEAEVCDTREAARARVVALAQEVKSVGFGGSLSVACLNLTRELRESGKEILNHGFPNLSFEEKMEIMRRQLTCDLFLSSINALTSDGVIVNVDGNGNRVASTISRGLRGRSQQDCHGRRPCRARTRPRRGRPGERAPSEQEDALRHDGRLRRLRGELP